MRRNIVALMCAAALLVTGCSSEAETETTQSPGFDALAEQILETAREDPTVTAAQLSVLDRALEDGVLTQSLANEAKLAFFECLTELGLSYDDLGATSTLTYARYKYIVHAGSAIDDAEACFYAEFSYVDELYQLQPAAVAERRAYTEAQVPALAACLEAHGYVLPSSPTWDEVMAWTFYATTEDWITEEPVEGSPGELVDCVALTGTIEDALTWKLTRNRS